MKKLSIKTSLLVSAASIAGLAMGASIALATHPPIQLYTYEEVANQFQLPALTGGQMKAMPVLVNFPLYPNNKMMGMPYSPKQTCSGGGGPSGNAVGNCHNYNAIADHAFHAAMGMNEWMDNDANGSYVEIGGSHPGMQTGLNMQKPWVQNHAMYGKFCPPSLRQIANLQKDNAGNILAYNGLTGGGTGLLADKWNQMVNGGGIGSKYAQVDNSLWEYATVCNSCHVGGALDEHDRNGVRLSTQQIADMTNNIVTPFTSAVWENYDPTDGSDNAYGDWARWTYPATVDNKPTGTTPLNHQTGRTDNAIVPLQLLYGMFPTYASSLDAMVAGGAQFGAGTAALGNKYATPQTIVAGQLMMPNVREMDCLFCHLKGYNNVMASVMVQAGQLNAAPMVGAGLMDSMPISQTYQGYNSANVTQVPAAAPFNIMGMKAVFLNSTTMTSNILAKPNMANCLQCHATEKLKDFPQMFTGFLSAAPMIYDPSSPSAGPTGKRMPSFDLNAPWLMSGSSLEITGFNASDPGNYFGYGTTLGVMPMAYGPTVANAAKFDSSVYPGNKFLGGGNPAGSGPMYFTAPGAQIGTNQFGDQNVLKRSIYPFPRSDWFKRGDAWQAGMDVHTSLGCAGCHLTDADDKTRGGKKNQCDPGRGFDMLSNTQDGVPPLVQRNVMDHYSSNWQAVASTDAAASIRKHDTRNTVKRCEFCHITGKDYYGTAINTFGAPNPTAAHAQYGLAAPMVQMVDKYEMSSTGFGSQGIPSFTNFTTQKTFNKAGSHLDIIDCSVCHVQDKKTMAVRALDATSGIRYPVVIGTDKSKGLLGMFEDPAPESTNAAYAAQYNQMYGAINTYFGLTMTDTSDSGYLPVKNTSPACADMRTQQHNATLDCTAFTTANPQYMGPSFSAPAPGQVMGGPLAGWKPLHMWQKLGNMDLPLSTPDLHSGVTTGSVNAQMSFRRKITLGNVITAAFWNNTDSSVDANGDGVPGGLLIGDAPDGTTQSGTKASLHGYTDIFTGLPPTPNDTAGYGDPIFDPYLMRNLKAGMTFAPGNFGPIPVGFGGMSNFGGAHMSAYDANFNFTGAYKFVGIWGGGIILTEPDQISDYKAYRQSIKKANEPSWAKAQLSYYGVPFMVTHGVKPTSTYALGKDKLDSTTGAVLSRGCTDCHSSTAGFFQGNYDMVGPAIPADKTYDPTRQFTGLDANGDPTYKGLDRIDNGPMTGIASGSPLMGRPLENIPRIKAAKDDLFTGLEIVNKLGQPRTIKFQAYDNANIALATNTWTVPAKLGDVLYPDTNAVYKDINGTNHSGSAAWITYLSDSTNPNMNGTNLYTAADNAKPTAAEIASVYGVDVTPGAGNGYTYPDPETAPACVAANTCTAAKDILNPAKGAPTVNVYKGDAVALVANKSVGTNPVITNPDANTYHWTVNDGTAMDIVSSPSTNPATPLYGSSADGTNLVLQERDLCVASTTKDCTIVDTGGNSFAANHTAPGTYRITLTVHNPVTGEDKQDIQFIRVLDKPVDTTLPSGWVDAQTLSGTTVFTFVPASLPAGFNKVKIAWGDGGYSEYTNLTLGTSITHAYNRLKAYRTYDSATPPNPTGYSYKPFFSFIKTSTTTAGYASSIVLANGTTPTPVTMGLASDLVTTLRVTKPKLNGVYNVKKGTSTILVLTVTNKGPDANYNIPVTVPSSINGLSMGSPTASTGAASISGTTWTIGTSAAPLAAGAGAYYAIPVTVPASATGDITVTLPATIGSTGIALPDTVANNPVTVVIHPY